MHRYVISARIGPCAGDGSSGPGSTYRGGAGVAYSSFRNPTACARLGSFALDLVSREKRYAPPGGESTGLGRSFGMSSAVADCVEVKGQCNCGSWLRKANLVQNRGRLDCLASSTRSPDAVIIACVFSFVARFSSQNSLRNVATPAIR
jgi:hypothetical protein